MATQKIVSIKRRNYVWRCFSFFSCICQFGDFGLFCFYCLLWTQLDLLICKFRLEIIKKNKKTCITKNNCLNLSNQLDSIHG